MSDYSCGAIKLKNNPNGQIKTGGFSGLDLVYGPPSTFLDL